MNPHESYWLNKFADEHLAVYFEPDEGCQLHSFLESLCDRFGLEHDCTFTFDRTVRMAIDCAGWKDDDREDSETLRLMYCHADWYEKYGYEIIHWKEFLENITDEEYHRQSGVSDLNAEALSMLV